MLVSSSSSPNAHSTHRTLPIHSVIQSLNKLTLSTFSVRDCSTHWEALPSKIDTEIKKGVILTLHTIYFAGSLLIHMNLTLAQVQD